MSMLVLDRKNPGLVGDAPDLRVARILRVAASSARTLDAEAFERTLAWAKGRLAAIAATYPNVSLPDAIEAYLRAERGHPDG